MVVVPLTMLKIGYRHVGQNGDGYFWKDRGVVSHCERYDKEKYYRDDSIRLIHYWSDEWVLLDIGENPDFDVKEPNYISWNQMWTEQNLLLVTTSSVMKS